MKKEYKEFNQKTGEQIAKMRIKNNYTRECLAAMAGISPKFLYEIETGKKGCSSYVLYRIARSLKISADEFFREEQNVRKETGEEYYWKFDEKQKEKVNVLLQIVYEMQNS